MSRVPLRDPESADRPLILQPHQWQYASDIKPGIVYGAGGWGSDKSYALLQKIALLCNYNPPGTRGAVVLPTGPLLRKFMRTQFLPAFRHLLTDYSKTEYVATIHGGREIYFISAWEPERMELLTLAWAVGDEAGLWPHEMFIQMISRVRDPRAKYRHLSFVGIPRYGWLYDEFGNADQQDRRIYRLRTEDNQRIPQQYIDSLLASCPASSRRCYLDGEFVPPGGSVFPEYDESKHVIDYDSTVRAKTIAAVDWSPRTPHVLIMHIPESLTVNGRGVSKLMPSHAGAAMVVVDEIVLDGSQTTITTERLAMTIRERGWRCDEVVCDPAGGAAEATSGIDQIRVMQSIIGTRMLYATDPARRSIRNGIEHVHALLDPAKDHVPRLYISRRVVDAARSLPPHMRRRSISYAIRNISYPEIKDGSPVGNVPAKDGITDHAVDCLRYAVVYFFPMSRLIASAL